MEEQEDVEKENPKNPKKAKKNKQSTERKKVRFANIDEDHIDEENGNNIIEDGNMMTRNETETGDITTEGSHRKKIELKRTTVETKADMKSRQVGIEREGEHIEETGDTEQGSYRKKVEIKMNEIELGMADMRSMHENEINDWKLREQIHLKQMIKMENAMIEMKDNLDRTERERDKFLKEKEDTKIKMESSLRELKEP